MAGGRCRGTGEKALSRHGVPRDPHAAQRHSRHDRSPVGYAAHAGAIDLCQSGEIFGRGADPADRGHPRFFQDRVGPARPRHQAVCVAPAGRGRGRAAGAARPCQGHRNRRIRRRCSRASFHRRCHPPAPGSAQSHRQCDQVYRNRRRRDRGRAGAGRRLDVSHQRHRHRHRTGTAGPRLRGI